MKRIYKKAVFVGVGLGFFALLSMALFNSPSQMKIPRWDSGSPFYFDLEALTNLDTGRLLDLQHQAVFLRFLTMCIDHGFLAVSIGIGICVLFAFLEDCGEKNIAVASFRRALKFTGMLYLFYWLITVASVIISALSKYQGLEPLLLTIFISFWMMLPYGIFASPFITLLAFCVHFTVAFLGQKRERASSS